jgi:hypothetical protein
VSSLQRDYRGNGRDARDERSHDTRIHGINPWKSSAISRSPTLHTVTEATVPARAMKLPGSIEKITVVS